MKYVSTRGNAPELTFDDALLTGLARDGGLYLPKVWPQFSKADILAMQNMSYADVAIKVMSPFVAGSCIEQDDFEKIVRETYAVFDHDAVAPLKQLAPGQWVMELFHGPTLAFKDYALQLVGRLFDYVLTKRNEKVTIVGATSGDTGSAAIEACRDKDSIEIFILHPNGRVSDVQRRQMTTIMSANVHNVAIEGTFDDCQDMVKAMFNDEAYRDKLNLSAVNSINWARIMAQIVYYFYSAAQLGSPHRDVAFSVPTGNFGNVFAGYCAQQMGLPVSQFIVASNRNDILTRFLNHRGGNTPQVPVEPSHSPSMDIQVSSNFERLLYEFSGRDGAFIAEIMDEFRKKKAMFLDENQAGDMFEMFHGYSLSDKGTLEAISDYYKSTGELFDPHSVVGIRAAADWAGQDLPIVSLATAHPAKFPDAVKQASGVHPNLPPRLSDLLERKERYVEVPNDLDVVKLYVTDKIADRNNS
ncbi:MAG: threonine synthase [Rhodospirillales bacterium]|nr:threonine synthase [Rhodospirillales bacterium]